MIALLVLNTAAAEPTWSQLQTDSGWNLSHTTEHSATGEIQIYKQTVAGVACFRGQSQTSASAESMLTVAMDVEGAISWSSAGISEAETLSRSASQIDYYQYLNIPIISDRFWFLRGTVERSGNQINFHWSRLHNGGEHAARYQAIKTQHPNAIEPPVNVGAWSFETTGNNVLVRYYICTDPGGRIPASLQVLGTEGTLPDTIGDLVTEAKRR